VAKLPTVATFGRREALKLGALGLVGCSTQRPEPRALAPATETPRPSPRVSAEVAPPADTFTLAFGSCSKPSLPQPLWEPVRALAPDAWAWLGDIVYADTDDIEKTRALYAAQAARSDYATLVASTRVVGIWDDHDYGRNDAGSDYGSRVESQAALLDFLAEPAASPRRKQRGTYASYTFGEGRRRVKLILLDGRYHRDRPGPTADTLGAEQWTWLEGELKAGSAELTVIASSYQLVSEQHPNEKWADFPAARRRFLDLLARPDAPGVVLLSGDRHFAELSRMENPALGYPLHELTSSGLTHSYQHADEANRFRQGDLYRQKNFGVVRVDWPKGTVTLEARGEGGLIALTQTFPLSLLRG